MVEFDREWRLLTEVVWEVWAGQGVDFDEERGYIDGNN